MNTEYGIPHQFFRMTHDTWFFAVLLETGDVIGVENIDNEWDDYIDFSLLDNSHTKEFFAFGKLVTVSVTSRKICTVRKKSIIAIQELSDS